MKKMKKMLILATLLFVVVAGRANAAPINWVLSPNTNAIAFGVTVVDGLAQIGSADYPGTGSPQPQGIFGAGFTTTGTDFTMLFDADLYTWDSYNANLGLNTGTGYWDAFVVTVSTTGYYWDLSPADPIASSASTFVWGGTNYNDGILESYITAPGSTDMITLSSLAPTTFYVSLVLDTKTTPDTDILHPSWGSFHVSVVPEPATLLLLGSGLASLGFFGRNRRKRA